MQHRLDVTWIQLFNLLRALHFHHGNLCLEAYHHGVLQVIKDFYLANDKTELHN